MRRRDRIRVLLGLVSINSVTPEPILGRNIQTTSRAPSDEVLPTDTAKGTTEDESQNLALGLAIVRHMNSLSDLETKAFLEASKNMTDEDLLLNVRKCDEAHKEKSHFRPQTEPLSRFLGLLDRFMAGVTIGVQANPDISAIVIGGVRVVIDLAINFVTFFTKLSEMISRLGDSLEYLAEYAKASVREKLVLEALANVYGDLLQFCKQAYGVFTNEGIPRRFTSWRTFWRLQWIPFEQEFGRIDVDIRHHLKVLRHSAQALELNATLDIFRQERARHEKERIAERESFLNWISSIPFEQTHEDIYAKKHPGTGDWLMQTTQFREWFDGAGSALLWCSGKPGAGKSVLASNVLEHITTHRALEKGVGICFAYYSYQSAGMQESSNVISALIKQLCRKIDSIPLGFLRIKQDSLSPSSIGNSESFISLAQEFSEMFLLLDGLDECQREKRPQVLEFISTIMDALPHMKILITSRRETDLVRGFERMTVQTIEVEATSVAADISKYVTNEIDRLRQGYNGKKLYLKSKALEERIIETLTVKADGMFLWVNLQLASLCRVSELQKDSEVEKALDILPLGLDATYMRVLDQIDAQPKGMKTLAFSCLMWVVHARRPLTTIELQHALTTDELCSSIEDEQLTPISVILGACANLLVEQSTYTALGFPKYNIVRPVHYSVQEFLINPPPGTLEANCVCRINDGSHTHAQLAMTCLSYLQSHIIDGPCSHLGFLEHRIYENPFAWYAARSFDYHILHCGDLSDDVYQELSAFLEREDWFLAAVLQLTAVRPSSSYPQIPDPQADIDFDQSTADLSTMVYSTKLYDVPALQDRWRDLKPPLFALHRACSAGLASAVASLLADRCDVNEKDSAGVGPLYYVASRGDLHILSLLLEKGADVNMQGGHYHTALQVASSRGYKRIVQLLLDHNAEINAQGGYFDTALSAASIEGHMDVVKLLISAGADVNVRKSDGSTSSNMASLKGHEDALERSLSDGADIRGRPDGETALHVASWRGHRDIVEQLLSKGADTHALFMGRTALHIASDGGHEDIVELLLSRGADFHARFNGRTTLHMASHGATHKVAEVLLSWGADIEAQCPGGTALQIASRYGCYNVVELLLSKGADIQVRCGGKTALQIASSDSSRELGCEGHKDVIKLLISHGATYDDDDENEVVEDKAASNERNTTDDDGTADRREPRYDASDHKRTSTANQPEAA